MILTSPTPQKQRGAYYTPRLLADYLVRWAIQSPTDRVLDPACGEAVFLEAAHARLNEVGGPLSDARVVGFEIDEDAAAHAVRLAPQARVVVSDFFTISPNISEPFDAIVGNPPYVRYHHFDGDARDTALARARSAGVELSRLASSWAPFVVHAASFLKPDGRMAFVLPAELLGTDYAGPVRAFLEQRFARIDVFTFESRIFPGALVDAVLLLAYGTGPGEVRVHRLPDVAALDQIAFDVKSVKASGPKWTTALVSLETKAALDHATAEMAQLGQFATVDIGIVTGANRFFLLSDLEAKTAGIAHADLRPLVARGHQIPGHMLTKDEWQRQRHEGETVWLFAPNELDDASRSYISNGEAAGVHLSYKCRIRNPWWKLKVPTPPDLILSYMSNRAPRLVANSSKVLTTNILHNVRLRDRSIDADLVALAWINSATMLACELGGRAYGGGVLKLETREAERLPLPQLHADVARSLRAKASEVDAHLRCGRLTDAADVVDQIVLADISPAQRAALRSSWLDLQARRRRRSVRPADPA